LTGEKFGKLTAIRIVKTDKEGTWWLCECDCGKEKIASTLTLRRGSVGSCGCKRVEHCQKMLIDLTGKRYGKLTVLKRVPAPEKDKSNKPYWLCECDCGNRKVVLSINLKVGGTKSCGCLRKRK
jgi:hypothetical protein